MNALSEAASASVAAVDMPRDRRPRFLARQPILDTRLRLTAHELLLCSDQGRVSFDADDDSVKQVLDNMLVVGADGSSSNPSAFVKCTRKTLVSHLPTLLPPRRTVLEILETVPADEEVVSACRAFRKMGYRIALDYSRGRRGIETLLELANYVKIDFRASDAESRAETLSRVKGLPVALLAEGVENQAEFAIALSENFTYVQGYFFCRPTILARDEVPPDQLNSLRLAAALARSPLDHEEIERIVKADAPLCFRLLRLVNSPLYGMRGETRNVRRALYVLGDREFRKLASIAIMNGQGRRPPHALLALSLQRARLCELLAPHLHQHPTEQYLMGLFSLLEAVLQTPMALLLKALPLRPPIRAALLGEANAVAAPLTIARCYETGDWNSCAASQDIAGLGSSLLNRLCIEATAWAGAFLQIAERGD